mgnify:CR=1 FL=1
MLLLLSGLCQKEFLIVGQAEDAPGNDVELDFTGTTTRTIFRCFKDVPDLRSLERTIARPGRLGSLILLCQVQSRYLHRQFLR